MRFRGQTFVLAVAVVIAGLGFGGCDDDDDTGPVGPSAGTALVRIAHLSPDAGPASVDVRRGTQRVLSIDAADFTFGTFTTYQSLEATPEGTTYDVTVTVGSTPVSFDAVVREGAVYTIAATGRLSEATGGGSYPLEGRVYSDDLGARADEATIHFVHAASGVDGVDVTLRSGDALFSGVAFGDEAPAPAVVAGGAYDLQVRAAGTDDVLLAFDDVSVAAGTVYTVWAVETPDDGVTAIVSIDETGVETTTALTLDVAPTTARVRIGHLSPDAGTVSVELDGSEILPAVDFSVFSEYLTLDPGYEGTTYRVVVRDATDAAVIDTNVDVTYSDVLTVAAIGPLESIQAVVVEDDVVTTTQARLNFVHAADGVDAVDVAVRDGNVLFGGVAFGSAATGRASVPGGIYDLQVRAAGTGTVALGFDDVEVDGGSNYTVWAVELPGGGVSAVVTVDDLEATPVTTSLTLDPAPETARLRIGHLSPDAGPVTVLVDDTAFATDVDFAGFSEYREVPGAYNGTTYNVKVQTQGGATPIDANVTLDYGSVVTVVAIGPAATIEPLVVENEFEDVRGATLDFVHAAASVGAVDVTLTNGTALFSGVAYGAAANDPTTVPGGIYDLQVRAAGTQTVALSFEDVQVAAGDAYTVWAVDRPNDAGPTAIVTVDDLGAASATVVTLDPATVRLRVAHLSPDAPPVDVYLDGEAVDGLVAFAFGGASDFLDVTAATHRVQVYAHPADPRIDTPVIDTDLTLLPGVQTTVAATGLLADIGVTVVPYEGDQPMGGNGLVRFVHASPDAPAVKVVDVAADAEVFALTSFGDEATDFVEVEAPVPPQSVELEVRTEDDTAVLGPFDLPLVDGDVLTVYAIGSTASATNPLQTLVLPETVAIEVR